MLSRDPAGHMVLIGVLGIALLAPLCAAANDPEPKKKEKDAVITEEDLARRYGASDPAAAQTGKQAAKPDAAPLPGEETAGEVLRKALETEKRKVEIVSSIERLRKRIAALRNPFLPRIPETEQEKRQEQGMDAAAKVELLERRIGNLEKELERLGTEEKAPPAAGR